ncbi:MAG TPA: UDP-N-acetylmuramoyl-tripeptide--D-alanyl-D-alanine ligase [Anaerolineae bacterium]|nr:UDP-N-acetylmuramoyl-tripeptide--D-alanyl-D-alanine ligase [Anaerolineae bacterium]
MIQALALLLLLLWSIRTASSASLQAYLWQLKEYRLDRLLAHMTTLRGRRLIVNPLAVLKGGLLLTFPLLLLFDFYRALFPYAVVLVYGAETARAAVQVLRQRFRRPILTAKATLLLLASLGAEGVLMLALWNTVLGILTSSTPRYSTGLAYLLWTGGLVVAPPALRVDTTSLPWLAWVALLLDRTFFLVVFAIVLGLGVATGFAKRRIIRAARRKIQALPLASARSGLESITDSSDWAANACDHLTVIGITGSYGKTSTKAFLHTILSARFKALRTVGSTNTDIGVARAILRDLTPEHEVFVVEMGAYRRGEIKAICDLVRPRIGILTGINEQHLALFKTLETTVRAKAELIEALPEDGLAILNGDSPHLADLAQKVPIRKKVYSTIREADVYAEDIVVQRDRVSFRVISDGEAQEFQVGVLGAQNVPNLLAAVCAAQELGMSLAEIAQAARAIEPPEGTMRPHPGIRGTTLIDDTYSANPDGVLAALEYLQGAPAHRRVMVTPGILELGSAASEAHRRVGRKMAQVCDLVIITSRDYARYLLEGAREGRMPEDRIVVEEDLGAVARRLRAYLMPDDVVLFQGRGPEWVLKQLKA